MVARSTREDSELSLIDGFTRQFPLAKPPRGPGDDCAVLPGENGSLCVTVDSLVEDVHFTRRRFSPEDIGHKALAVNLSDLAAMGAKPRWFLCAIALPRDDVGLLPRIGRGMAALAVRHRISLAGGNLSRARELSITITAAGAVRGRPMLRSGARPGDQLYVSGTLGEAAFGLRSFGKRLRAPRAALRQRRPEPRVALGQLARRFASAALDLSDGLSTDLPRICRASRVGASLESRRLPIGEEAVAALGVDAARALAVSGGEDYELLLTIPAARCRAFESACARAGERITCIGEIVGGRDARLDDRPLDGKRGFQHFGG